MVRQKNLIKLKNIYKTHQLGKVNLPILNNINLEIPFGSFVSLMGASGSGKSTLLNIISCLDTPTAGSVFWKEQDVSNFSEDELAEIRGKKIGFVFQHFNLLPNFNALENIMLPMIFQGMSEEKRRKRAKLLLSEIGLEKRILHKPSELSGGEQQRVSIMRALSNDPELIVADEPTGSVDSKTGKIIMDILIDLHKNKNKTIIMVTHDINVASCAQKIINIKDGKIV